MEAPKNSPVFNAADTSPKPTIKYGYYPKGRKWKGWDGWFEIGPQIIAYFAADRIQIYTERDKDGGVIGDPIVIDIPDPRTVPCPPLSDMKPLPLIKKEASSEQTGND